MNKPIDTFSSIMLNTQVKRPSLKISTFCAVAFLSLINIAHAATQADCGKAQAAVAQALTKNLPADPQRANDALNLQREGEWSCQQGDIESGQSKLHKAAAILNPETDAANLANIKGESHE